MVACLWYTFYNFEVPHGEVSLGSKKAHHAGESNLFSFKQTPSVPQGSCTMKLNSTTEMLPCSMREFNELHPFVPREQAEGYMQLLDELHEDLCTITGYDRISFQPNRYLQNSSKPQFDWMHNFTHEHTFVFILILKKKIHISIGYTKNILLKVILVIFWKNSRWFCFE